PATLNAVLGDPSVDAVVLATPHSQHVEAVVAAAAAGKAVYCEKPLALTRAEAERAVAACERAGVVLAVGTDKRFFPAMQELARIVAAGELGPLLHIEGHFSNETYFVSHWRDRPEESPAGGMTSTGIHALDAMVRMAGPVHRVQAMLLSHQPPPDPLDTISALLEFRSGISGALCAIRTTPIFWRVHVFGKDGSAEALGRTELVVRRRGARPERVALSGNDSVRANLEAFADAVSGAAPYPVSMSEMIDVVAAFEAIANSAGTGGRSIEV
ncbi:MAG TPA: Gfo/Idh/MocA family oxidoreductase, partial [Stellaceae bacterium]|nr:Gfo/Idh/MocA family oxidoreductase [Stellaceae bacterium]